MKFKKYRLSAILLLILMLIIQPLSLQAEEEHIDFFYQENCKYCEKEMSWLKEWETKDDSIKVHYYKVEDNPEIFKEALERYNIQIPSTPILIYQNKAYVGYIDREELHDPHSQDISSACTLDTPCNSHKDSLVLSSLSLGFMDGFNPCALWILILLINIILQEDKTFKLMWISGSFILASALFYYFILNSWINIRPFLSKIKYIQTFLALTIILFALNDILKLKREKACQRQDSKIRSKILEKVYTVGQSDQIFLNLLSITAIALAVQIIELACSLGFPVAFTELLYKNQVYGIQKQAYILLYILAFSSIDIVILGLAIAQKKLFVLSAKQEEWIQTISSYILLLLGIYLLV